MQWLTVVMVAVAGFFGAGTVSLWRTDHRYAAGVLAAVALVCLAIAIVALLPGTSHAAS